MLLMCILGQRRAAIDGQGLGSCKIEASHGMSSIACGPSEGGLRDGIWTAEGVGPSERPRSRSRWPCPKLSHLDDVGDYQEEMQHPRE
jgi:hypothetical protein